MTQQKSAVPTQPHFESVTITDEKEDPRHSIDDRLLHAVESGNIVAFRDYLDDGVDVNLVPSHQNPYQSTLLSWAAWHNRLDIVVELLARDAGINKQSSEGSTPLSWAVYRNHEEIVAELVKRKADTELKEENGETPLWQAVANRYDVCMSLLLNNGADFNATNDSGVSVLHQAVADKNISYVRRLLACGANVDTKNSEGVTALHQAVHYDDLETVEVLLDSVKPIKHKMTKKTKRSSKKNLVNTKDDAGESPLLRAVLNRSQKMVELLISVGASLGAFDLERDSELSRAIYDKSEEITKILLDQGPDVHHKNGTGMTAFLWAAYRDDVSVGKLLLDAGADVSAADKDGMTALHFAAERGNVNFAEMLLQSVPNKQLGHTRTLDIEAKELQGHTPLLLALNSPWYRQHYTQSKRLVTLLLEHEADTSAKNKNRQNSLHLAALQEFTEVFGTLLSRTDIEGVCAKDQDGDTPLHSACRTREDSDKLVKLLLDEDAMPRESIAAKNLKGETALGLALESRNTGVLQLLIYYEVDVRYDNKLGDKWPTMEQFPHQQVVLIEQMLQENENSWTSIDHLRTLNWAARNGRESFVRRILSAKDYSTEGLVRDVLYWVAVGGRTNMVPWLFQEHGGSILANITGSKTIQAAASNGHQNTVGEIIQYLIGLDENRFSISKDDGEGLRFNPFQPGNIKLNTTGWTPLHWVVNYRSEVTTDIVRHMLMNGADPEVRSGGLSARELAICWGRDSTMRALLQAPLRVAQKPQKLKEPLVDSGTGIEEACNLSPTNIIDFCTSNGRNCTLESKSTVFDIIYKKESGPGAVMNEARDAWMLEGMNLKHHFRWIHLPANNWTWAEDLAKRIYLEPTKSNADYTRVKGFMESYRREHKGKPLCRFMYPALSFEREEFSTGEGDTISELQHSLTNTQVKEDIRKQLEKSIIAPIGETHKDEFELDPQNLSKELNKVTAKPTGARKKRNLASGSKLQQVGTETKQGLGGKTSIERTRHGSDLTGIKMSICIPFLTFHSVSSHRALRQAVRFTDEVKRLQAKEHPSRALLTQEELRIDERQRKSEARELILDREIKTGFEVLSNTKSNLYEYFSHRWSQVKYSNKEQKLRSLRDIHRTMRRSIDINSPGLMEWLERLSDAIEICVDPLPENQDLKHEILFEHYLKPHEGTGLHPSRTLDQYYYSALSDTSRRDVDQVVRRYQARTSAAQCRHEAEQAVIGKNQDEISNVGGGKTTRKFDHTKFDDERNLTSHWDDDPDAQICMVDQLWLWVLDDETIVTCFPPSSGLQSKGNREVELLDRIREHIHDDTRPHISSAYHLATTITSLCVRFVEECQLKSKDSLLQTFASSIGTVADEEVKCFENFRRGISQARKIQAKAKKRTNAEDVDSYREKIQKEIQARIDKVYHERYPDSKIEDFQEELRRLDTIKTSEKELDVVEVDIQKEIKLLEEIKDIRDELNILKSIFEDQRNLLNKLFTLVRASHLEGREATQTDVIVDYYHERSDINLRLEKVNKMEMDAKITYDSMNHLLDLKQKNANLSEAVQARKQAEQSARQGRTILVFTIVTIVFLPLSFLSSFYSLKIESFPRQGDDSLFPDTWIFSRIFGTSAALAIPLIILAVYVNDILKYYQKYLQQRISSTWIGFKGIFVHQSQVTESHKRKAKNSRGKREGWGLGLLASRKKERLPTIEEGENR